MKVTQSIIIILDSAHGQYIPRDFLRTTKDEYLTFLSDDEKQDLSSPDNEWYWETWDRVLNNFEIEIDGFNYSLHHDGDLFLVSYELMTDEEKENLFGDF